jgi:hypothetical protein
MMREGVMNEILRAINGVLQCWAEEDAEERVRQYQLALDDEWIFFMERQGYYGFENDEWI